MTCVLQAQKPVTPAPSRDNSKKTMTIITRTIDDNGNVTEERTIRPLKEGEEMQWNSSMDEDRSKSNSREKRIIIRKDDNDEVNIEDGNDEDIIINIPELKDLPEELQKELKGLDIRMLDDQGDDQGKKGFLGVVTESKGEGVSIEDVVKDSPAEKAGLKEGDIILSIDGKDVKSPDALFDAIRAHAPGDKVQVRVQHDGKESVKDITLDKVKELRIRTFNWNKGLPPDHFRMMCPEGGFDRMWGGMDAGDCEKKAWLGIEYRTTNKGLLVTDVMEKSPAQQAGFQPGDFIEKIDGAALKDGDDLKEILSKNKPGNQVRCGIRSEGQRKDITVQLANKCGKGKESMLLDKKERQLDKQNRRMEMEDRKMEK
jgi:predicted metalloprotease with PDZ domain